MTIQKYGDVFRARCVVGGVEHVGYGVSFSDALLSCLLFVGSL